MMKQVLLIFINVALAGSLFGQNACPCCSETHQQFDFWVGDWIVLDTLGKELGKNQINKLEDGCIISEHWEGARGGTGRSYNYFDLSDSTWNQLWIDNSGNILKLKGRYESGKMTLKSDLQKGVKVDSYYNQISWSNNEDGTVTQLWEIFDPDHVLIQTSFLGIYHRIDSD